jgi:hypothetical protein
MDFRRWEVDMSIKRIVSFSAAVFIITLLLSNLAFSQAKKEYAVSYYGNIESVVSGLKAITVNEAPVFLSADTEIFNVKGESISLSELKFGLYVHIEGIQKANGVYAKKISVRTPGKKK